MASGRLVFLPYYSTYTVTQEMTPDAHVIWRQPFTTFMHYFTGTKNSMEIMQSCS